MPKHRDIAFISRYFIAIFLDRDQSYAYKWLKRSLSSSFDFPRWSCELPNLQTWQLCSFILAVERARKNVCCHYLRMFQLFETQCNECCSCWCTNGSFLWAPFKDIFWYFCLPSFTKCFNIEGNLKKTALERMCEWSLVLWKIPLGTPLGHQWVHNCTSRRRN